VRIVKPLLNFLHGDNMKNNGFAGEYEEGDDWVEKEEQALLDNGFSKPYVASMIHEMKKTKKDESRN